MTRNAPNLLPSGQVITDTAIHLQWAISGDTPAEFHLFRGITRVYVAEYTETEYTWTNLSPNTLYPLSIVAVFPATGAQPAQDLSASVTLKTTGIPAGGGSGGGGGGGGGSTQVRVPINLSNVTVNVQSLPLTATVSYDNDRHVDQIIWMLAKSSGGIGDIGTSNAHYKAGHGDYEIPPEYLEYSQHYSLLWRGPDSQGDSSGAISFDTLADPRFEDLPREDTENHPLATSIATAKEKLERSKYMTIEEALRAERLEESKRVTVEEALKAKPPHVGP